MVLLISLSLVLGGCFVKKVAPGPPSNLIATAISYSQIDLTWQDNSEDETGFYIYRKNTNSYSNIANIEANTTFYNDTGLSPGTTYSYKVCAYNNGGESESSNEVTITTPGEPTAPSAPSNLAGQAVSFSEIDLTWQDNSTNEEGFYIYRKTTDDYSRIATMEDNATSYNNTGLSPEISYSYKVTAHNDVGESESSNAINITTPEEPLEPPSNPMAEAISYKQINLTWQDNSDDEDNFRITCDMGLGPGNNQFLVRLPANTTRYEHRNLQPMREYKYFVMAERNGIDADSERFWATTPCPVTAIYETVWFISENLVGIDVGLKSEADEVCRVKAIVSITDYWGEVLGSIEETFEGVVPGEWWNSGNWWILEVPITGGSGGRLYAKIEITDVEILY